MGYHMEKPVGAASRCIDLLAYKDELSQRIVIKVDDSDDNVTKANIESLYRAMRDGDFGLFVTLSDYTAEAESLLQKCPSIKGINGSSLVKLTLKHYEKLSEKYHQVIPLQQVYILAPSPR